jgi:hypothetical protein
MTPARIASRAEFLVKTFRLEPARRRFLGSSANADPRFFAFLEFARRSLPPSARGVDLYAPGKSGSQLYLAAYTFAPLPTISTPVVPPPDWVAVAYGPVPPGWTAVRRLPGGAIIAPSDGIPPRPAP